MSLRDKIVKNPLPAAIVAGVVILLTIILIIWQLRPASTVTSIDKQIFGKAFFTDDDGQTFYVDDAKNVPPYSHNGKMASRALVYSTVSAPDKRFVTFMEQYKPADKKAIEDQVAKGMSIDEASVKFSPLVKRPKVGTWLDRDNEKARKDYLKVIAPVSPDKKDTSSLVGPLRPGSNDLVVP